MIATKYDARSHDARCDICPLAKDGVVVPPTPATGKLRLVVVGEGPGRIEEKMGMPFVGLSGKFLDERLRKDARVARADCHLTNAALCRGESDDDNERAAECCAPRLLGEVAFFPENTPVVALGKAATRSLLGARNILTARGFIWTAPEIEEKAVKAAYKSKQDGILKGDVLRARQKLAGRVVLPSIHPAFVLRADTWKPISELDFRRVGRVVRDVAVFGGIRSGEDEVGYAVGGPEVLSHLGDVVSCDIETDGIKPLECNILSIGFADNAGHVVEIWPWSDEYAAEVSWHLGRKHEVVLHNGQNFDLLVLENHGVTW
jgi:uracil-DNA glycosylase family 4